MNRRLYLALFMLWTLSCEPTVTYCPSGWQQGTHSATWNTTTLSFDLETISAVVGEWDRSLYLRYVISNRSSSSCHLENLKIGNVPSIEPVTYSLTPKGDETVDYYWHFDRPAVEELGSAFHVIFIAPGCELNNLQVSYELCR